MQDLDAYRTFIEKFASYGYALFFRRFGDFERARTALENAFVEGRSAWLLHPDGTQARGVLVRIVEQFGGEGAQEPGPKPEGILAGSRKLQALDSATELLRSIPGDEQVALFLLHVEEVAPERVLAWMEKDPAFLAGAERSLKERLAAWAPSTPIHEEPSVFFYRALRQHRLSSAFAPDVLLRLRTFSPEWSGVVRIAGWALLIGIPVLLFSTISQYGWPYDYDSDRRLQDHLSLLLGIPIDFFIALAALLVQRALRRHAPAALKQDIHPSLLPALRIAGMAGFGFVLFEALILLDSTPISHRGLLRSPWFAFHIGWALATLGLILTGLYQVACHYLRMAAADRGKEPS
jgi:hypothetical protein